MDRTELFGIAASVGMVTFYALEDRGRPYLFGFAACCAGAAAYAAAIGSMPFLVVESVWAVVALRRALRFERQLPGGRE